MPDFSTLSGKDITALLAGHEKDVVECVRDAYLTHESGESVNPDSYFLRFPDKPDSRIIALPAYLGGHADIAGIKWISSFPGNVRSGLPRASAVLVLNDYTTGYPFALMEAAGISAARTAASAALATTVLAPSPPASVGFLGGGVIARTVARYLHATATPLTDVRCHDIDGASSSALRAWLREDCGAEARSTGADEALDSDLVVLATTALSPHIPAARTFRPGQLILNISLRDMAPELLLTANNVLDDVDHCLKAGTSPHLAEQLVGHRDFVTGTLAQVMRGDVRTDPARPTVFSPFGLGVLDLAVGHHLYRRAEAEGRLTHLPDFFGETRRW
ncbi:2,3-diaminopropionate biosynthesis protein SbnB [Streptomyces sp. NBC_01306]|uniref:2,3-diaminopropionate biosynthesis protein SbnB n=1 Tax=Streptomyces sp. NBC_01306 TaxID=2903819 RepID=UPI00224FBAEA|nr:2,3-diaminopropionate biosynthesis protein SbnB [Streptomyces sp. NBC_01306]MCX4725052.1 2,3-diaminopropionate biosynthesis protein SbnB [Streptomyces sp. NBC_01306]